MNYTASQSQLISVEDSHRHLFCVDPKNPEIGDPYVGLSIVFDQDYRYQPETEEEEKIPKLLSHFRKVDLQGSAIVEREEFLKNWKEFTQGCFDGLNWDNVFAAGGSILACLSSSQDGYRASGIDLFIYGIENEPEANQKLQEIYFTIKKNTGGKADIIRTNRALTILCPYPFRHIQVILRLYQSPGEILLGFDIDSCCVGYDGKEVWGMQRFKRALVKRYNLLNKSRRSPTYEQRLFKYSKRGFAVAVPGLDKQRINPDIYNKTIHEVNGLAKLILYDYNQTMGRSSVTKKKRGKVVDEEGSDYNNDIPIPWGPEWQTDAIINLLNSKNKAKFFSTLKKTQKQGETPGDKYEPVKDYNHLFTSTTEKLESGNFSIWKRSLDGVEVQQTISWPKANPVYQDADSGNQLMTGSFQSSGDDDWEKEAYLPEGETSSIPHPMFHQPFMPNIQSLNLKEMTKPFFGSTNIGVNSQGLYMTMPENMKPNEKTENKTAKTKYTFESDESEVEKKEGEKKPKGVDSKKEPKKRTNPPKNKAKKKNQLQNPINPPMPLATNYWTSLLSSLSTINVPFTQINSPPLQTGIPTLPQTLARPPPLSSPVNLSNVELSKSPITRLLLLISLIFKEGRITSEEKGKSKDLVLNKNPVLLSALEVYEIDQDLEEFVDTLRRICAIHS